jgi:tol-pal system protein YbgF
MTTSIWRRAAAGPLAGVSLLLLGACATKSDIRNLQQHMLDMQRHQDEALMELQRQNRLLLDSIRAAQAVSLDTRGTMANQLRQFDENVRQMGQLVGDVMGTLARIEQRLTALERSGPAPAGGGTAPSGGGNPEQYYESGMQRMSEGSYAMARLAFEMLVREFPGHESAPAAQFQIGQTYYHEKDYDDAFRELEKVAAQWPQSDRAPAALFRAGAIAEEQNNIVKAREYYTRVRDSYRNTDEGRQAVQKLNTLPRR